MGPGGVRALTMALLISLSTCFVYILDDLDARWFGSLTFDCTALAQESRVGRIFICATFASGNKTSETKAQLRS